MSVIVIAKFPGGKATTLEELAAGKYHDIMQRVSKEGQQQGAIHHVFLEDTDGGVLVLDEWESAEAFHGFFSSQDEIKQIAADAGVNGPPEVTVYRILDTPDTF